MRLLEQTRQSLKQVISNLNFNFPQGIDLQKGKISKGEQYRQLPYWVLDYPKKYTQNDIFSFRTMIWWGHELSCTLMLAEESWEHYRSTILQNLSNQLETNWYIGVNTTPWEYHFEEDNYLKLSDLSMLDLEQLFKEKRFGKIACKLELTKVMELPDFASTHFKKMINLLQ